ncbi:MAG: hypothetical protein LBL76_07275, partial [Treponema sp.]|nr:hypothetical protein [Treponema sp.]
MELIKMIVTDSRGQTFIPADTKNDTGPKNLAGTHGYVYFEGEPIQKDPYSFWALEVPNPTDADTRPYRVTMVSPLGGPLSGLYRYPKIGEQVLVGRQGAGQNAEHFMLGYVPTAENPFNYPEEGIEDTRDIFEEAGELLRYLNTAYGANAYSEIGFRRAEKAQWPIEERDEKGEQIFPPIDVLTLDSAGNIRETAENHLMQKAARIELLVDVPEVLDRGTNAVDEAGTLPIGDYVGDDSGLHRGDLHIRAGNRVVIKADQEIRLQVGRTIVRIDDRGFNVVTKNVSGNYVNSYDTSLDMSPRNGIVLNGKSINLQAGYRLNMGDGMGATVAATMGNLNISGREISIDSYNSTEYLFHTIYQGLEYLVNAASGGMALGKADIKIADYVKYSEDSLESLVKIARKIFGLNAKRKAIRKERLKEDPPQVVLPPEAPPPEEQLSLESLPEPQLPDLPQVEPPPQEDLQVVLAPEPPPQEKSQVEPVEKTENPPKVDTAQVQDASHPTAEQSYGQVKSLMSAQDKTRAAAMYQKGGGGTNPG